MVINCLIIIRIGFNFDYKCVVLNWIVEIVCYFLYLIDVYLYSIKHTDLSIYHCFHLWILFLFLELNCRLHLLHLGWHSTFILQNLYVSIFSWYNKVLIQISLSTFSLLVQKLMTYYRDYCNHFYFLLHLNFKDFQVLEILFVCFHPVLN